MADPVDLTGQFAGINIGSIGFALLIFFLALAFVGIFGAGLFYWIQRKKLKYTIPLYKKIGNRVIKIATFKAMDYSISRAGDKLWYVPKAKKYIGVGSLQSGKNEYSYFERSDGEWINFEIPDIDMNMKEAKVKYLQQDMRAQRIAISSILEQRFANKQSWWDQYGNLVTYTIFYLVVAISMVVIFYQWSDIADKTGALLDRIIAYENMKCPSMQGVVPAFIPLLLLRRKKWKQ